MESKDSTMHSFYQLLGRVFYATAKADDDVHKDEINTLKQALREDWSGEASPIEVAFDQLVEKDEEEKEALNDFKAFKSQHPDLFTDERSKLIMDTASKIASSFAKRNKSELVLMSQLFLILKD